MSRRRSGGCSLTRQRTATRWAGAGCRSETRIWAAAIWRPPCAPTRPRAGSSAAACRRNRRSRVGSAARPWPHSAQATCDATRATSSRRGATMRALPRCWPPWWASIPGSGSGGATSPWRAARWPTCSWPRPMSPARPWCTLRRSTCSRPWPGPSPADLATQRDLLVAWAKVGQLRLRQKDPKAALSAHAAAAEIASTLAAREPNNREWQRDLSVARLGAGDAHREGGDMAAALEAYAAGLAIRESLAAAAPEEVRSRRDLAVALERVAIARHALGDRVGAPSGLADGADHQRGSRLVAPGQCRSGAGPGDASARPCADAGPGDARRP